jgi:hypothetical protein
MPAHPESPRTPVGDRLELLPGPSASAILVSKSNSAMTSSAYSLAPYPAMIALTTSAYSRNGSTSPMKRSFLPMAGGIGQCGDSIGF